MKQRRNESDTDRYKRSSKRVTGKKKIIIKELVCVSLSILLPSRDTNTYACARISTHQHIS